MLYSVNLRPIFTIYRKGFRGECKPDRSRLIGERRRGCSDFERLLQLRSDLVGVEDDVGDRRVDAQIAGFAPAALQHQIRGAV
jgi:hypothetical protein